MAHFPTTFTEAPIHFESWNYGLSDEDVNALSALEEQGIRMEAGLRREDVPALTTIAGQEGTLEFCPNDIATRWTDEKTAERQVAKDGGRGVMRAVEIATGKTAAFGWVGKSSTEERTHLPDCENTFAIRVNAEFRGRRLATPVSRLIVAGAAALYGARNIGLETWGSNRAAVRSYIKAGAVLVDTRDDRRPTRIIEQQDVDGKRRDVRLYMQFLQSLTQK